MASSPTTTVNPFAVDFSAHEITGVVRSMRAPTDEFLIVNLDGDRTATGELSDEDDRPTIGLAYRWFGTWTTHDKYGDQFRFDSFSLSPNQQQMGVVAYLSRKPFNLTKANAMRIWSQFGADSLNMVRHCPSDVITLCAFPADACATVHEASLILNESEQFEEIKVELFELFAGRGFPGKTVKACIATWGMRAPEIIRRDPFQLLVRDVPGVGFKRADKLFIDLGGSPLRLKRQTLAAWEAMRTNGNGNTWESKNVLCKAILDAAGSVDGAKFERAIELGLRAKWLAKKMEGDFSAMVWGDKPVAYVEWFAERAKAAAEQRLSRHILRVMKHKATWPEITVEDLPDYHQRGHLCGVTKFPLCILGGTPGTGKTFSAAVLIRVLLRTIPSGRIAVCAPTGKAAVRITEALRNNGINSITATTIHQLLEVDGSTKSGDFRFQKNEGDPLAAGYIFVDESSMLDVPLAAALFAALPNNCNIMLIGDPYQLPPVGHGATLRDMIQAKIPTALLTEIKRNDGTIVRACQAIKDGQRFNCAAKADPDRGLNLLHIAADSTTSQLQAVVSLLGGARAKGFDPIWDVQVVCVTNEKSEISRKNLNVVLQDVLNPLQGWMRDDQRNPIMRPGDKVICLKNCVIPKWEVAGTEGETGETEVASYRKCVDGVDCYVANGDMGKVLATSTKAAIVKFLQPERLVCVNTAKAKKKDENGEGGGEGKMDFSLAYAITAHKSQGSEYALVIVVIDEGAGPLGCRELLYTAISRASKLCFLVGSLTTAWKWVTRVGLMKRKTFLAQLIQEKK